MAKSPDWRWHLARPAALMACAVVLLTLAFAPVGQFYLAWVGLAPWIVLLAEAKSKKSVFFWSWIAGTAFFTANMWWIANITWPGMFALMIYCGLYWAAAGLVIRGAGLLRGGTLVGVLGIAAVWVAFEWLRSMVITGLPWLFLGHTQTPFLMACQIADVTGAYGVTFWVVSVNALAALAWIDRDQPRGLLTAAGVVAGMTVIVIGYGIFRMNQTSGALSAGPTIALVQSNYPQNNRGEKSAEIDERLKFHFAQSISALSKNRGAIDLVVWSETMMYAMNGEARQVNDGLQSLYEALSRLAATYHVALLTGGDYDADWQKVVRDGQTYRVPLDRRNTAYFFDRDGRMDDTLGHRYDKIHLVPWGEYIPGKDSFPLLYHLSVALGPKYYTDYIMHPGAPDALTVFHLERDGRRWRFVTPICFEDIDATICSAMFRPGPDGAKRADFLVNLTNDGWFKANENAQHLQAATFRSIENRVWTARSVNTGISGFIDSNGDTSDLLEARSEGTSVRQIMIDGRLTFYTRFGDLFAELCAGATVIALAAGWRRKAADKHRA